LLVEPIDPDGVRAAAQRVNALTERIDGLLHSAADFGRGRPDVDGLPLFVRPQLYDRYHLTQLLLPKLLMAQKPE